MSYCDNCARLDRELAELAESTDNDMEALRTRLALAEKVVEAAKAYRGTVNAATDQKRTSGRMPTQADLDAMFNTGEACDAALAEWEKA